MAADWSLLPSDLVEKIARNLPLPDYLRFGAVCMSWHCVTREKRYPPAANQLPWLALCDEDENGDNKNKIRKRGFFNLTEKKLYHLDVPEAYGKCFCGSSYGWLITVDVDKEIHLLNPFSRSHIRLPPMTTFYQEPQVFDPDASDHSDDSDDDYDPEIYHDHYIYKAIIFSDTPSTILDNDYVVVAIYGEFGQLAFSKAGDKQWTTIETNGGRFHDIIRYKGDSYAITCIGRVFICDLGLGGTDPKATEVTQSSYPLALNHRYLVESSGDLLQVLRYGLEGKVHKTTKFYVYKQDVTTKKWVELKSLGDRILFLGYNYSISLSSSDFPGSKGNLIYFTDDYVEYYSRFPVNTDLGVFNLADGTIEPYYPHAFHPAWSLPIWVTPNPW